jgi:hypothetical protein
MEYRYAGHEEHTAKEEAYHLEDRVVGRNDKHITIALQGGAWSGLNWLDKGASDGHL